MLGVELGEEFDIKGGFCNPYMITERGLLDCVGDESPSILIGLLDGSIKIIKKPWIPKDGENIFYIYIEDEEIWDDKFHSDDLYSVANLALDGYLNQRGSRGAQGRNHAAERAHLKR